MKWMESADFETFVAASEDADHLWQEFVTIAGCPVTAVYAHAKCSYSPYAQCAYGAEDLGYGYCGACELVLQHDRYQWFPIDWDRRSRDGFASRRSATSTTGSNR